MKALVICNVKGRIIAISRQRPAKKDQRGGVLSISPVPNAGQLVYELDLPEGMEKESNLIGCLRVELSYKTPYLVRVHGGKDPS